MPSARAQVFAVLDQTVHSIQHIDKPALRAMMPVLLKAQAEVQHSLRLWLARDGGATTFTAQRYRNAIIVLNRALASARQMEPVTAEALKHSYKTIGPLALRNLQHEWKTFSTIFEGTAMPLALDEAAVIANGKSLLWPQFESSAERYAGSIGERTKLELAVSRAKSETMDELTNRLQKNLPDIFDGERWAAERLARTESMSAYATTTEGERWDAERLARTESMASYSTTSAEGIGAAKEDDPELVMRWDSSIDFRRCAACASLDGKTVEPGEMFHAEWYSHSKKGGMRFHSMDVDKSPLHPCCRCVVVPWRESWAKYSRRDEGSERAAA